MHKFRTSFKFLLNFVLGIALGIAADSFAEESIGGKRNKSQILNSKSFRGFFDDGKKRVETFKFSDGTKFSQKNLNSVYQYEHNYLLITGLQFPLKSFFQTPLNLSYLKQLRISQMRC